jgi:hypothetical protein
LPSQAEQSQQRFLCVLGRSRKPPIVRSQAEILTGTARFRRASRIFPIDPCAENISDEEVREVQEAALQVYPDFIVVISGVTDGCACEEGRQCSAQVGLALNRNNVTRSLLLSRINGHWKVGAVQSWWLQYREFERTHPRPTNWDALQDWERERQALLRHYPACAVPAANWTLLRKVYSLSTFVDISGFTRRVNFKDARDRPNWKPWPQWLRFSIYREAFDCKDHRQRTDKSTFYFEDGTARQMPVIDPVLWDPVKPDTTSATDLEMVCGWKVQEPP